MANPILTPEQIMCLYMNNEFVKAIFGIRNHGKKITNWRKEMGK